MTGGRGSGEGRLGRKRPDVAGGGKEESIHNYGSFIPSCCHSSSCRKERTAGCCPAQMFCAFSFCSDFTCDMRCEDDGVMALTASPSYGRIFEQLEDCLGSRGVKGPEWASSKWPVQVTCVSRGITWLAPSRCPPRSPLLNHARIPSYISTLGRL